MDPAEMIVKALAAGAVEGLAPAAEEVIKDGFNNLKALLQRKFSGVNVTPLEKKPSSQAQQTALTEQLKDEGADRDEELFSAAQELLRLIESQAPQAAEAVGVDLKQLKVMGSAHFKDITAEGGGLRGEHWEVGQDLTVEGVHAGQKEHHDPND